MRAKLNKLNISTLAATTLLSVAWLGSAIAQDGGITPGQWEGGDETDNDPFYACLNVSDDGQRLTAINTECRGNQGQNQNSIDINWEDGKFADGTRCDQNSYRNIDFGDIAIIDNKFSTTFKNYWVDTTIDGTFDPASQTVTGTARTTTRFTPECSIEWNAAPATAAE